MLVQPPPPQASVLYGARAGQSSNHGQIVKSSADSYQPAAESSSVSCNPRSRRGSFLAPEAIIAKQDVRNHNKLAHDCHVVHLAVRPKPPVRCGQIEIHTNCGGSRHVESRTRSYATSSDAPYSGHLAAVLFRFRDGQGQEPGRPLPDGCQVEDALHKCAICGRLVQIPDPRGVGRGGP